jgi:hypothetical protein
MAKLTIEQVKSIKPYILLKIINKAKKFLKNNKVVQDMFKEHNVPIDNIDYIPMRFGDLDVSAQTRKGIIIFNYKLLSDGDFFKDYGYAVHEMQHYLDQCYGEYATQGAEDGEYLDNPAEIKGFQVQLKYLDDQFGKDEAQEYADHLVDYHNIETKSKKDKKEELLKKVDD